MTTADDARREFGNACVKAVGSRKYRWYLYWIRRAITDAARGGKDCVGFDGAFLDYATAIAICYTLEIEGFAAYTSRYFDIFVTW